MTNVEGKVVAFSATLPPNSPETEVKEPNDEETDYSKKTEVTPMLVEVSMVTTVARPMNLKEFEDALEFLKKSKDSVQKLFKKGKDFYDKHNLGGAFKAMQGVGDIVSGIMKFMPDKEDPMVAQLASLESDVKQLGDKLTENFNEMKTFITEVKFFSGIISPTTVLTKYMRDCLKNPSKQAATNFQNAYLKTSPLKLQYNLMGYLSDKSTNPLTVSMENEKVKLKSTFEKWEDMICRVMAQFLLLEAFAAGLLERGDSNFTRLTDASDEVFSDLDDWKEAYKKDESYWTDLKGFFEDYIINHTHLNNYQKGEELKAKLENYLTNDAFYFFIFNEAKWNEKYTYYCPNEKDKIIGAWNKGKCNAFVYRSRTGARQTQENYATVRSRTLNCANDKLRWTGTLQKVIENQLLDQIPLRDYGFVCLLETRVDPQVYYMNYPGPDWLNKGPGHVSVALMNLDRGDRREYQIVVGFK